MVPAVEKASTNLKIEILSASELLDPARKDLLRSLCRLINDAFSAHGHPKDNGDQLPGALFVRKRLILDEELPEGLGPEALLAFCTDDTLQDSNSNGNSSQIGATRSSSVVATASLQPWKGKAVDIARSAQEALDAQLEKSQDIKLADVTEHEVTQLGHSLAKDTVSELSDSWNWEVKLCASSEDLQYRGRGLITRCLDELVARLRSRQITMRSLGDPKGDLPIKLWSTSLEGTGNTEYWLRRGFKRAGEADLAPQGTWTSTRDISISTLWKMVE